MLSKVPIVFYHSGEKNSKLKTNETLKFPLTRRPRINSTTHVNQSALDSKSPIETNIADVDVKNTTFLRPFRSAYLGIKSEEIIHPKKKQLPKAPI